MSKQPLSKLTEEDNTFIKLLAMGDSGAGKTCGLASWPKPMRIFDCDGKASSLALFMKSRDLSTEGIEVDNCAPRSGFNPGAYINDEAGKIKQEWAKTGVFPYATIAIDSMTTLSDAMMQFLIKENPGIKRQTLKHVQLPCQQDWGVFKTFLKQFLQAVLNFPCNVYVPAHIKSDKDEVTGAIFNGPMLSGTLAKELPIYFPEVYRIFVKDGVHFAQTQTDYKYALRSQIPFLPKEVPFNYQELIKQRRAK